MRLKRLLVPKFWKTPKKSSKWVVSPSPGAHKKFESIPLVIVLRDILKVAETASEAKTVVKNHEVLVDGKYVSHSRFSIGLLDTLSIPKIGKYYRVVPSVKGLHLLEISEKESKEKLASVKEKTIVKGKKIQLNLHDGKNIIVDKDSYKTGDSLLLELPSNKIIDHVKMEAGSLGLIIHGKNSGKLAKIKKIVVSRSREPNKAICEADGNEFEVMKAYVIVVGKTKPLIKVGEQE
ncbi:MAG: 30S ribosomal protein S4e [Candidatus Aenigmarchaeota archaeon]|nr:30S ribosomal protein S4e [Candidatus Aenigmarchaeota archaeon]